jgi:hypothetical protein
VLRDERPSPPRRRRRPARKCRWAWHTLQFRSRYHVFLDRSTVCTRTTDTLPLGCLLSNLTMWSPRGNDYNYEQLYHYGFGRERKTPIPSRFPTVGIVPEIRRASTQLPPQASSPCMVFRLPPLWRQFNESPHSDAWAAIRRGWPRALRQEFI